MNANTLLGIDIEALSAMTSDEEIFDALPSDLISLLGIDIEVLLAAKSNEEIFDILRRRAISLVEMDVEEAANSDDEALNANAPLPSATSPLETDVQEALLAAKSDEEILDVLRNAGSLVELEVCSDCQKFRGGIPMCLISQLSATKNDM